MNLKPNNLLLFMLLSSVAFSGLKEQDAVTKILKENLNDQQAVCAQGDLLNKKTTIRSFNGSYCNDPAIALFADTFCKDIGDFNKSSCATNIKNLKLTEKYYLINDYKLNDPGKIGKKEIEFYTDFYRAALQAIGSRKLEYLKIYFPNQKIAEAKLKEFQAFYVRLGTKDIPK